MPYASSHEKSLPEPRMVTILLTVHHPRYKLSRRIKSSETAKSIPVKQIVLPREGSIPGDCIG